MSYMQVKPANGNAEAAANGDSNGVNGAAPEEEEKNPGAEMLTDEQVSSSITNVDPIGKDQTNNLINVPTNNLLLYQRKLKRKNTYIK